MIKARRLFESFTFVIWRIVSWGIQGNLFAEGKLGGYWPSLRLLEVTVYEGLCHGTLSHRRRNALDGPMADVTTPKRAGHGGFKVVRQTFHRPASRRLTFAQKVGASEQIAARITEDGGFSRPFRVRRVANGYEKTPPRGVRRLIWKIADEQPSA
jgi:hypothetical protein